MYRIDLERKGPTTIKLIDAQTIKQKKTFVTDICKLMMIDLKKYGLTVNIIAGKIMPSLTPALANPTLNVDEVIRI